MQQRKKKKSKINKWLADPNVNFTLSNKLIAENIVKVAQWYMDKTSHEFRAAVKRAIEKLPKS